jgi:phosphatidylinositol alpha-1,6-mannosyltransferase
VKILIPTADYPPIEGGIGTLTLEVSRELAKLGHDVTVIAPYFPGWSEFDSREPYKVIRFSGYRLGWFRFFPMLAATWRHMRNTDIILAINVSYGGIIGLIAQRYFDKPYVTFGYAYEFLKFRNVSFIAGLYRGIYASSRAIVAISGFTCDNLVRFGAPPDKIRVILPGATPSEPPAPEIVSAIRKKYVIDDDRVILAVGRLIPRKNHVTLLRAMPKILARVPHCVLVIVGRGPTMRQCLREAVTLGIRDHVVFPGYVPDEDMAALFEACDVFALPAGQDPDGNAEGFGLVYAEAHAHSKPVVAGNAGGVPDAVIDDETGILVEPDNADAVADAILRLLEDPALAQRMGKNGRQRVETELNWAHFTKRLARIIEQE